MNESTIRLVMATLTSPTSLSNNKNLTSDILADIERQLGLSTSQSYQPIFEIEKVSDGLELNDQNVSLIDGWGVTLTNKSNSDIVEVPSNIRTIGGKFYIANNKVDGTLPCIEVDSNLNLLGGIGIRGDELDEGEYDDASDFIYNGLLKQYFIASKSDNIVHAYDGTTKEFIGSIGSGDAGADGTDITSPVAVAIGTAKIYVLCQGGTYAGATGVGFLATYKHDRTFISIPLYPGKNNGIGKCFQGEILAPKDMVYVQKGGKDHLYILNSTDEIGLFDCTDFSLKEIINIPSSIKNGSLGLNRIAIDDNNIYVSSSTTGRVIAINLKDKSLVGTFGKLADESTTGSPDTLGYFNGLNGICVYNNKLYTAESVNNRIQTFGSGLFTQSRFEVLFKSVHLPANKKIVNITYSLFGEAVSDITILDLNNNKEYSITSAANRRPSLFKLKLFLEPYRFSQAKDSFVINPIYILLEDYL